jgi:hypothetical protein
MEFGDHSGKEAEVKPEEGEVMQDDGSGDGGSAMVVVETMPEAPQMDIRMDVALLHCQACLLPLRPPVFKVSSSLAGAIQDFLAEITNLFGNR